MKERNTRSVLKRKNSVSWYEQRKSLSLGANRMRFNPERQTLIQLSSQPTSNEGKALWDIMTNLSFVEFKRLEEFKNEHPIRES